MKFYWFERLQESSVDRIVELSDTLESHKFSGILLPYSPYTGDYLIKVARAINKSQKLKYMIAIRPHAISGQYLDMIIRSISQISPNRMMINFVAGAIHSNELEFGGIIQKPDDSSTPYERKIYLTKYVEMFYSLMKRKEYRPEILVSGDSKEVLDVVEKFADYNIIGYSAYNRNPSSFSALTKRRMVAICPVIRDTVEEAELLRPELEKKSADPVFVDNEKLKEIILDLKSQGVTDILVHKVPDDTEFERIYEFVKDYSSSTK